VRRNADLVLCCGLSVLGSVAVVAGLPGRQLAGTLIVLLLPAWAASRLPGVATLATVERVLIGVAFSVGAAVISSIVLQVSPWPLDARTWAVSTCIITVAVAIVGIVHGPQMQAFRSHGRHPRFSRPPRVAAVVLTLLALVVTVVSLALAQTTVPNANVRGYTMLAASPQAHGSRVVVSIVNQEPARTTYKLVANAGGRVVWVWRGISLEPSASRRITLDRTHGPLRQRFALVLYREGHPGSYRFLLLRPYCAAQSGVCHATTPAPGAPSSVRLVQTNCRRQVLAWRPSPDALPVSSNAVWLRSRKDYRWHLVGRPVGTEISLHVGTPGVYDWRVRTRDVYGTLSGFTYLLGSHVDC
jgi:hypothetical protein